MFEEYVESSRNRWSISICFAVFVCLLLSAPGVLAQTPVDFSCIPSTCTGTIVTSGTNASSTGISVFNNNGPFPPAVPFSLAFNTLTGTISIDDAMGDDLLGHIASFVVIPDGLGVVFLRVDWTSVPLLMQTQLGTTTGFGAGSVLTSSVPPKGAAVSVDVPVMPTPTPEPTSFFLCLGGIVLVGIKALWRR